MIPQQLIENALALTGDNREDMMEWIPDEISFYKIFSIEKFCYYLLSPEFIEKYQNLQIVKWCIHYYVGEFWKAIYEYQSGNEKPLISLLEKIWK